MKKLLATLVVNSGILWFSVWIFYPGFLTTIGTDVASNLMFFLTLGLVLVIVNFFVKPILTLLSLPLLLITFGLFSFVINAFVIMISWALVTDLSIGFVQALFTSLMLSLANILLIGDYDNKRRRKK